ncbi:unnamed protein product, partial [Mesorhabditis belari]|uniref:Tubby C-terminal domain-containing protein n=1 Tax=Mesorhabditis belari TaxID=2138241 RepID=A0AAF3FDY0_9BILA
MKIAWESPDWPGSRIDPGITCLTWMPQPDRPGHGMLGIGSESGAVGVTLTSIAPCDEDSQRYNFNLRGHHSTICMATWNKPQCKLASCDASGVIYVWVRNDDRWSVELVNDRGVKVRDLSWSPCGRSALICYEDNFVLVGSASGQRIWSHQFPAADHDVTCGVWAAESREIILGFATGSIQVMFCDGGNITERSLCNEPITKLACSTEINGKWTLAALTERKLIMISAYDQVVPHTYTGTLLIKKIEWNSDGTLLAAITELHQLLIFDREARLIHREEVPLSKDRPLSAFTWAHNGKTIVVAAGGHVVVGKRLDVVLEEENEAAVSGKVLMGVPSLFNLVTYAVWRELGASSRRVDRLPLPNREKESIKLLDHHIIRCRIPRSDDLCKFVCTVNDARSYCTIRPLTRGSHSYVLCMEHMGGLVPLLVGRQVNRFLPQFHVSLHHGTHTGSPGTGTPPTNRQQTTIGGSAQVEDMSVLPRTSTGRNSLWRRSKRQLRALMSRHVNAAVRAPRTDSRLVHVSSNVWCTRFQVTSLSPQHLPGFLAQIVYKTSVLHLQPRQMTVQLANMSLSSKPLSVTRRSSGLDNSSNASSNRNEKINEEELNIIELGENETEDDLAQLLTSSRISGENGDRDDGLTHEERLFFDRVLTECASLRAAMELAVPSTSGCLPSANTTTTSNAISAGSSNSTRAAMHSLSPAISPSLSHSEIGSLATSALSWQEEVDSMEYIDGADEEAALLNTESSERSRQQIREKGQAPVEQRDSSKRKSTEKAKDNEDIRTHLDKLSRIAAQLGQRQSNFNKNRDRDSIRKMRTQVKELLRRVNEIEKKVGGADVRGEVRDLVHTIEEMKRALGEGSRASRLPQNMLTLHNKAPIWNETNQVYQLDFGGRVTQESAKNFQIEVDSKQVLQFGRIEGGAYTLDFRAPFCAAQAFAVALASITQRLK